MANDYWGVAVAVDDTIWVPTKVVSVAGGNLQLTFKNPDNSGTSLQIVSTASVKQQGDRPPH